MHTAEQRRIIVACTMKSGSTYVSNVLARYFEVDFTAPQFYWGWEHNLIDSVLSQLAGKNWVLQMHLRPHPPNLEHLANLHASIVVLWRNLGDAIVSFDDHVRRESHVNPVGYVHDPASYLRLPDQDRYQYLIRHAVPWYIAFYLHWRAAGASLFVRYEWLVRARESFFAHIIQRVANEVDRARLSQILTEDAPNTRFNRGIAGRSSELFSDETKQLLVELLKQHPEDLSELRFELPWETPSCQAQGCVREGQLLRSEKSSDAKVYFVRYGKKCWVTNSSWLIGHGFRWPDDVHPVSPTMLDAMPDGPYLL